jgi:hypothetical protein
MTKQTVAATIALWGCSPAIDRGTSVKAPIIDYAGVTRPRAAAVDIGACEF